MQENVPGICEIDTRALTKIIREKGSILGRIVHNQPPPNAFPLVPPIADPNKRNLVADVSRVSIKLKWIDKTIVLLNIILEYFYLCLFSEINKNFQCQRTPKNMCRRLWPEIQSSPMFPETRRSCGRGAMGSRSFECGVRRTFPEQWTG